MMPQETTVSDQGSESESNGDSHSNGEPASHPETEYEHDRAALEAQTERNRDEGRKRRAAILDYLEDVETGAISTEIAQAVGIHRTQTTDHLDQLRDDGKVAVREPNSRLRLWYLPRAVRESRADQTDQAEGGEHEREKGDDQQRRTGWGSVSILADADRHYLRTGETGGIPEALRLTGIWERLCDEFWEIPFDDAPKRAEMALLGARIGYTADELLAMAPEDLYPPIADEADRVLTDYDDLYRYDPTRVEPTTIRDLRAELDLTQGEVAARASEQTAAAQSTIATRLSLWESRGTKPDRETAAAIVEVLQHAHQEHFGSLDVEPTWIDGVDL